MVEPLTKREYYVNKITGQAVWEDPMKWKSATADGEDLLVPGKRNDVGRPNIDRVE